MIKKKFFYSHLVDISDLIRELDRLRMDEIERDEILDLIEDIFHHRIVEELAGTLRQEYHKEFAVLIKNQVDDIRILDYLKIKADYDPELKVITITEIVKKEILLDLLLTNPKKRSGRRKH